MFFFGKRFKEEPISGQLEIDLIMSAKKAIEKVTLKMFEFKLDENPKVEQKYTVMWDDQMRLLKPSDCTFVSLIILERQKKEDNGMFAFYIPDSIATTIGAMKGKKTEEAIMEVCGEYLSAVVEQFKSYLNRLGYESVKVGDPINFAYKVSGLFPYFRSVKYSIIFNRKKEKFVQAEVGIGPLKKQDPVQS